MAKSKKKNSDEYQLQMILKGTSYAMWEANRDKDNYKKFKKRKVAEFNDNTMQSMNILNILDKLGYPMDELGTYLYKDVINETVYNIEKIASDDMDEYKELLNTLNDAYSPLYHYIAREWKEMGVTSFHLFIERAIDKIDDEKVDKELSMKIYGSRPLEQTYGSNAFQLASFYLKKYSFDDTKKYQKPAVKVLSNVPTDVKLKSIFD